MQPHEIADSFGVREYPVRRVGLDAPWAWLAAGWADFRCAPFISLFYGAIIVAVASIILLCLSHYGMQSLMLVFAAVFLLIAPLLAVGLYEMSRRLELGLPVTFRDVAFVQTASAGQLVFLGLLLGFFFLVWVDVAIVIFALFFGPQPFPPLDAFIPTLLLTWFGVAMLVIGTMAGGVMAALVFSATVISIPLLMTRRVNAVTAMAASVQAVSINAGPLFLWAAIIAVLMILGFAAGLIGLALVFPLLAHASWHAFRGLMSDAPARLTPEQSRVN